MKSFAINNNTVSGNPCVFGSAQGEALSVSSETSTSVSNNILMGNTHCRDFDISGSGPYDVAFNDLGSVHNGTNGGVGSYDPHDNLSNVTPGFIGGDNYQLSSASPLVDAGSNSVTGGVGTLDAAGHTRVVAIRTTTATVDIGAYELQDEIFKNGFDE
jgi:hypothetical protein